MVSGEIICLRHSRRSKVIRWVAVWVWARQVGVWLVVLGHVFMWPCGLSKTHRHMLGQAKAMGLTLLRGQLGEGG